MEFFFDPRAFLYHNGLTDIRTAYDATMRAMNEMYVQAKARKAETIRRINSKELAEFEFEHDTSKIDMCDYAIENAESSANIARSGYVLMLYHYWEKTAAQWVPKRKKYDVEKNYEALKAAGVRLEMTGLERMRKLSNFIKRENQDCRMDHPEFFQRPETTHRGLRINHQDDLWLTSDHLDQMMTTLDDSGYPRYSVTP